MAGSWRGSGGQQIVMPDLEPVRIALGTAPEVVPIEGDYGEQRLAVSEGLLPPGEGELDDPVTSPQYALFWFSSAPALAARNVLRRQADVRTAVVLGLVFAALHLIRAGVQVRSRLSPASGARRRRPHLPTA